MTTARPRRAPGRSHAGRAFGAWLAGCLAASLILGAGATAFAKPRVAITTFDVTGDAPPAVALQLQDGFVLALFRQGLHVIDPTDVARRSTEEPALAGCESSPCLKKLGLLLEVGYVMRVAVEVSGNGYKMRARVFATGGTAPAALPVEGQSRTCDVCTVAEARDTMMRLADAFEPLLRDPPAPPRVAAPPPPSALPPMLATAAGALAVVSGVAALLSLDACDGSGRGCSDQRVQAFLGGALVGAGAVTAGVGGYVMIERLHNHNGAPALTLGFGTRF